MGPGRLRRSSRWTFGSLIATLTVVAAAGPASAHDNTSDGVSVEVNDQRILVMAPVPFAELGYRDTSGDGLIDETELLAQESERATTIVETVREHVSLTIDGKDSLIIGAGVPSPAPILLTVRARSS